MTKVVPKKTLDDEEVFARTNVLYTLLPLGLMVAIKVLVMFQSPIMSWSQLWPGLFQSGDWSLASGMVYISILSGMSDASHGRKLDTLRVNYRTLKLLSLMLVNFVVYFCASVFNSSPIVPWLQLVLFIHAIWMCYRYQRDIYLVKSGFGKYDKE
nr:hypothetical protein BCU04_03225 [Vibrio cyclitrophicus]